MKFSIYKESRLGARKSNQDRMAYSYSRDALLLVVADGMGGHLHGEVAAQIAVQFITESFQREARPSLSDPSVFLSKTITNAHHAIVDYAADGGLLETPRTTCVACVVQDNVACWAHAGDSRLYHIREGRIMAQTKDHSRVQQLIDRGLVREEAFGAHPDRNKIFNCLGSLNPPQVDLSGKTPLHSGDTLLLCTDGLWGPLSGRLITGALHNGGIMAAVPGLLDEAQRRSGRGCDNLSVVAVTWEENFQPTRNGQVSTRAMQRDSVTTELQPFGAVAAAADKSELTDEEIERAIAEIRGALKRHSHGKT